MSYNRLDNYTIRFTVNALVDRLIQLGVDESEILEMLKLDDYEIDFFGLRHLIKEVHS